LDFSCFPETRHEQPASAHLTIASIGRAVEKKGYGDLLTALATLPPALPWRFAHIGGGPLARRLDEQAERLGIADRITWRGAQDRAGVFDLLNEADLFVLPSRVAKSGDRDGLPNVLMEAQAFAVPVLATDVSGIPELVLHGETGWLVPQRKPQALAAALDLLLRDAALRQRLGEAGARRVRGAFSSEPGIARVADLLRRSRGAQRAA
jgi:glycosyltransferase involved in cell wall biosynthesis